MGKHLRSALTLVETLCVIAIIAALTALAFPVLAGALANAKASKALSNLKQLALAVNLYRVEYDGNSSGSPAEMGMLDFSVFYDGMYGYLAYSKYKDLWKSACGGHPQIKSQPNLAYFAADAPEWVQYTRELGERSVLFLDYNCNSPDTIIYSTHYVKRIVSVRLDGSAKISRRRELLPIWDVWR